MSKKYTIVAIIMSLLIAIFLGAVMPKELIYRQGDISFNISMRVDNLTTVKIYYLESEDEEFSEAKCVSKKVEASPEFKDYIFDLPVKGVKVLRIDCDTEIEFWDIESITVDVDGEKTVYNPNQIDLYDKNDIPAVAVSEGYITLRTGDSDPYLVTKCDFVATIDKSLDYRLIVMSVAFVVLLLVMLCNKKIIIDMLMGIWAARKQIKSLAISDFKSRFSGSYLGVFWGVIQPIMTILLFWFVFQVGFRSQPISNAPFILWLVAGMIPWNFFSDAWLNGNNSFTGYSYIVKKLVFNIDILPVVKILASSIMNIIFNLIIIVVYALYGRIPVIHLIDMLYFSLCLTLLAWGLSMITATLNVFMKDVGQFLNIAMQFIMWLTPIMWDYNMIPVSLSWLYKINPLFYVINGYREALIDGKWFFSNFYMMLWFWAITIAVNVVGIRLMKKLKPHFADVL